MTLLTLFVNISNNCKCIGYYVQYNSLSNVFYCFLCLLYIIVFIIYIFLLLC